jgi:hypothetical protein
LNDIEWRTIVDHINRDILGIIRAQQILAEVHEELDRRSKNPIEEDFIFADGFGHDPGAARSRIIDGVVIQVRVLHRRGLQQSDIKGADLLYEVAGRKFVLTQYKSPRETAFCPTL